MRKITLLSLLMFLTSLIFNVYAIDFFVAGFENGETGYNTEGWAAGYTMEITNNTESSGINNSDKCLMTTVAGTDVDRWGLWVHINLETPITITSENRYFKVMVKRTPNNTSMALALDHDAPRNPNTYYGLTKPTKSGVWCDVVFDLFNDDPTKSCENIEVQKFLICLGTWDGCEAGVTMLDNIVLSDNAKPRGVKEITSELLVNFDDEELTANNFASFAVQSTEAAIEIVANPLPGSEVNPSTKCLKYSKPVNTVWWHAAQCMVNGLAPISMSRYYLHVMMYIPDATAVKVLVKSHIGKQYDETIYPQDGEAWYDYVMDVSELDNISEISFRFNYTVEENWDNPAGIYYIDEFVLNNDAEPRETVQSGTKNPVAGNLKIYADGNMLHINFPDLKQATVYSLNGQLAAIEKAAGSSVSIELAKGAYIVKVENKTGAIVNQKVIVK